MSKCMESYTHEIINNTHDACGKKNSATSPCIRTYMHTRKCTDPVSTCPQRIICKHWRWLHSNSAVEALRKAGMPCDDWISRTIRFQDDNENTHIQTYRHTCIHTYIEFRRSISSIDEDVSYVNSERAAAASGVSVPWRNSVPTTFKQAEPKPGRAHHAKHRPRTQWSSIFVVGVSG